jgi:hypothetical protein
MNDSADGTVIGADPKDELKTVSAIPPLPRQQKTGSRWLRIVHGFW